VLQMPPMLCTPPTRSKYLYDMIRIQPGLMQACQIGATLALNAGWPAAGTTGGLQEQRIIGERLCPTAKGSSNEDVALGSGGSEVI